MWIRASAMIAFFLGIGGGGIFLAYAFGTGTGYWPRGEPAAGIFPWLNNITWLILGALQHSGMARRSFKEWLTRFLPSTLERSVYVALSGLVLTGLTFSWQPLPGGPIWHGPAWISLLSILGLFCAGGCCCFHHDHAAFVGLRQAWTGRTATGPLYTTGLYRFVRHPMILGLLLILWGQPIMQPELLLLNVGWTLYIVIGIHLEERDLADQFGAEYTAYRQKVGTLIPFIHFP
jgi:methanethiol S-methyltransferase